MRKQARDVFPPEIKNSSKVQSLYCPQRMLGLLGVLAAFAAPMTHQQATPLDLSPAALAHGRVFDGIGGLSGGWFPPHPPIPSPLYSP